MTVFSVSCLSAWTVCIPGAQSRGQHDTHEPMYTMMLSIGVVAAVVPEFIMM